MRIKNCLCVVVGIVDVAVVVVDIVVNVAIADLAKFDGVGIVVDSRDTIVRVGNFVDTFEIVVAVVVDNDVFVVYAVVFDDVVVDIQFQTWPLWFF